MINIVRITADYNELVYFYKKKYFYKYTTRFGISYETERVIFTMQWIGDKNVIPQTEIKSSVILCKTSLPPPNRCLLKSWCFMRPSLSSWLLNLYFLFFCYIFGGHKIRSTVGHQKPTGKHLKIPRVFLLTHLAVRSYQVLMREELHTQLRSVFWLAVMW